MTFVNLSDLPDDIMLRVFSYWSYNNGHVPRALRLACARSLGERVGYKSWAKLAMAPLRYVQKYEDMYDKIPKVTIAYGWDCTSYKVKMSISPLKEYQVRYEEQRRLGIMVPLKEHSILLYERPKDNVGWLMTQTHRYSEVRHIYELYYSDGQFV